VEILHGPMIAASADSASESKRREEVLATICSKLPDEYLHLVGEGKGVSINDWAVCGVQDIRKIVQRDGNYYCSVSQIALRMEEGSFSLFPCARRIMQSHSAPTTKPNWNNGNRPKARHNKWHFAVGLS